MAQHCVDVSCSPLKYDELEHITSIGDPFNARTHQSDESKHSVEFAKPTRYIQKYIGPIYLIHCHLMLDIKLTAPASNKVNYRRSMQV